MHYSYMASKRKKDPSPGQQFALYIIHSFSERNKILFSTYISTAFNLLFIKTFKDNHVESSPSNTRATPPQAVLPCSVEGSLLLTRKEDVIFSCKKNVNIFHRPISLSNNKLTMAKVKLASAGMGSPLRNYLNKRNACAADGDVGQAFILHTPAANLYIHISSVIPAYIFI